MSDVIIAPKVDNISAIELNKAEECIDAGFIADLERWYNLLREIASCEKEITYQEELRNKI